MAIVKKGTGKKKPRSADSKISAICNLMAQLDYNPKSFMQAFLKHNNVKSAVRRRYWGTMKGWPTTIQLLGTIRGVVSKKAIGKKLWEEFILAEALLITKSEKPPCGKYPKGAYHNANTISPFFFSPKSKTERDSDISKNHMPFLYKLLSGKMTDRPAHKKGTNDDLDITDSCSEASEPSNVSEEEDYMFDGKKQNGLKPKSSLDHGKRARKYIGLSSSQTTAHNALNQLSRQAERRIAAKLGRTPPNLPTLAPFLCFDNLDFEQKVHAKSIGRSNHMFHGTWGYIHQISQKLLDQFPSSELTLESYKQAMANVCKLQVTPKMFLPRPNEDAHWESVLKSQIAEALLEHIAQPSDSKVKIATQPSAIDQLPPDKPDITMLKLMTASDNSSQGVGEVFEAIVKQSRMSMTQFSSRLQVIDADLGSCTNISSLRSQRVPSRHIEESLGNILTILGGSHTLWNVAHAIYTKHFGDSSDSRDSGGWRFLLGLGIPCPNGVDKKDYTLMIKNMQKIHKATLVYCIKLVMRTEKANVVEELVHLPSEQINEIVDQTYNRFFTPEAKASAAANPGSKKLSNLLLRLSDFATVVEGNSAMKVGDVGRLMNVWKRWAVISQGLTTLTQYSIQLPRMILLLNEVLPHGLGQVILHSMLIAPSGQRKHFVAKDQHLEQQNCWLKYFFNNSGRGTNIDRLKNVYSVNINLLQNLISDLAIDAGKVDITQSHHNRIDLLSLNNCLRMCRQNDVCSTVYKAEEFVPVEILDFYDIGIQKLKEKYRTPGCKLNNLRPSTIGVADPTDHLSHNNNSEDVSEAGDNEPEIDENEPQTADEDESAGEMEDVELTG
ncbi:hypothetical protein PSHT_04139 [Puccinia striiformis]|uniref:DUF6589 domain-containing protein n=2 Tax=Puccinia striiformis TaxID=27350 RepID=A0A2S4WE17_9BASI|nr:hypothetical protein PSHT_04139 [Puccinia striiformis]